MSHRIVSRTTVSCDAPGCHNVIVWEESVSRVPADQVVRQRFEWHIRPAKRHICPRCWARGRR
jgi:hypothetical protein